MHISSPTDLVKSRLNNNLELPLSEQIYTVLKNCPYVQMYDFSIMQLENEIVISGKVNCYYHKQMSQETVGRFLRSKGMKFVLTNEIVVI